MLPAFMTAAGALFFRRNVRRLLPFVARLNSARHHVTKAARFVFVSRHLSYKSFRQSGDQRFAQPTNGADLFDAIAPAQHLEAQEQGVGLILRGWSNSNLLWFLWSHSVPSLSQSSGARPYTGCFLRFLPSTSTSPLRVSAVRQRLKSSCEPSR